MRKKPSRTRRVAKPKTDALVLERVKLAQMAADAGTWDWDIRKDVIIWSPATYDLHKLAPSTRLNYKRWLGEIHPDHQKQSDELVQHSIKTGDPLRIEFQLKNKQWIQGFGKVIFKGKKAIRMIGMSMDITERKRTEASLLQKERELAEWNKGLEHLVDLRTNELKREVAERKQIEIALRESLQEKLVLLQEIHHRVKNNMQVVSSLMRMQASRINDYGVLQIFQDCQMRIQSMALVHQSLYQSENFNSIPFESYLNQLCERLVQVYDTSKSVNVRVEGNIAQLHLDLAIPCGLILTELLTNALKYGFDDQATDRQVVISIREDAGGLCELSVSHNGASFPEDVDWRNPQSLGFQIIHALTKQIHGTISLQSSQKGFRVVFPYKKAVAAKTAV